MSVRRSPDTVTSKSFELKDEKVDARYEKGWLTIRVPKPADLQRQARRIDVRTV